MPALPRLNFNPDSTNTDMATPQGMRLATFAVNTTDDVHVYSDDHHIWLQLRRNVPTEQDIGRPSFKVAMNLNVGIAEKLGHELISLAIRQKERQKLRSAAALNGKTATTRDKTAAAK